MRHPNVQACLQWIYAKTAPELPIGEPMHHTAKGILQRFLQFGIWRTMYAPALLRITVRRE